MGGDAPGDLLDGSGIIAKSRPAKQTQDKQRESESDDNAEGRQPCPGCSTARDQECDHEHQRPHRAKEAAPGALHATAKYADKIAQLFFHRGED